MLENQHLPKPDLHDFTEWTDEQLQDPFSQGYTWDKKPMPDIQGLGLDMEHSLALAKKEMKRKGSRELALVITKLQEAIFWHSEIEDVVIG